VRKLVGVVCNMQVLDSVPLEEVKCVHTLEYDLFRLSMPRSQPSFFDVSQIAESGFFEDPGASPSRRLHMPGFAPEASENFHFDEGRSHGFVVDCVEDGFNSGRLIVFKCRDSEECLEWIQKIKDLTHNAKKSPRARMYHVFQAIANSRAMKVSTTMLVLATFAIAIVSAELQPAEATAMYRYFSYCDIIFTALFSLEVCIKLIAFRSMFFRSGWHKFDLIVVILSLIQVMAP